MKYIKEFAGAKFNFLVTASPGWKQLLNSKVNFSILLALSVDLFLTDFMSKTLRQLQPCLMLYSSKSCLCSSVAWSETTQF